MNWDDFAFNPTQPIVTKQTPASHTVTERGPTTGCYRNCYLCGIETARLHKDSIVSNLYTKERTREEVESYVAPAKYVITYCSDCYSYYYPTK